MAAINLYRIVLCEDCAAGAGDRCSTPGCALWATPVAPEKLALHQGPGVERMTEQEVSAMYAAKWFASGGQA